MVAEDPNMLAGKVLGRDGHSERCLAYFPELLKEHVSLIARAKEGNNLKFFIDDSKKGIKKFIIKEG